jgi:ankyrin repeat protein
MVEDRYDYQEAKLQYPFLEYAVENWAFHASKYDVSDDVFLKTLEGFLDPKSIDFRRWLEVEWTKGRRSSKSEEFIAPTPLHIAAFAGLTSYARKLLEGENLVDARDAEERTPLHWACTRGHTSMVLLLLENGAVPDVEDCRGVRPIYEAAKKNHATIVRILLEVGVDPLSPKTRENVLRTLMCGEISTKGETAVEYAYLQGHTDTIMAMVPFLTAEALEEMFCQCCRYGKFETARSVLATTGVLPDSKSNGATALYLACRAQCVNIVELLLSQGADVHQTSKWRVPNRDACGGGGHVHEEPSRSPVHGVIIGWESTNDIASRRILRLLVNSGANLEVEDENGDTPLLSLFHDNNSSANHPPDILAVKGLLQAGANVLALGRDGDSVLHRCLRGWGDIKVLKLLLEYGAHADVLGNDSNTVLHIALRNSSYFERMDDVIILLLEGGARCDVENKHKWTALEEAASSFRCSLKVFTMLLQTCSRPDAIKRCMWKLGRRDDMGETVKFIRALQKFDVLLEDRDSDGRTVLLTNTDSKELFDACIRCGADIKAVDSRGRGVLYYYVSGCQANRCVEAIQRLEDMVGMGLDPLQVRIASPSLCKSLRTLHSASMS